MTPSPSPADAVTEDRRRGAELPWDAAQVRPRAPSAGRGADATTNALAKDGRRFELFDSLRGAAALAVVGNHLGFHSGAEGHFALGGFLAHLNIGVTLFFLLSGFLLYRPYARAVVGEEEPPRISTYAWNRILRIVPAYWVALSVLALAGLVEGVWSPRWWIYYGFAQSFRNDWIWGGIGPAWSLSTEVSFYAILPLLGVLVLRAARGGSPASRMAGQVLILSLLGTTALGLRVASFGTPFDEYSHTVVLLFPWFAVGMLLAVAQASLDERVSPFARWTARHPGALWLAAAGLYAALSLSPAFPRTFDPSHTRLTFAAEHVLLATIALLVMLPAVFGEQAGGLPRRLLSNRTLAWLGTISYGIFLWHEPVLIAVARHGGRTWLGGWPLVSLTLATLPPVLVLAWLSHRLVETPALRFKNRLPFS